MKQKTYILVVNLKSRQSAEAITKIKQEFKNNKCDLKVVEVDDPSKIQNSFNKALGMKPSVIVLGGGDGTLITGIEYLASKDYKGQIGILPLGTANYLARNLSVPLDITDSVKKLLNGKSRNIPLGEANGKLFALTFVVGLTQVAAEQVSDKLKKKLGQVAYIVELLRQTKQHEPFTYQLESPTLKKPLKGTTHQILVYNSDINQQLKLVPDHKLEKSTLKVLVSRSGSSKTKLYFGFLAHILSLGKLRPYMYLFETQSLKITTKPPRPADYDGEPYGKSPFEISMHKKQVRIIC